MESATYSQNARPGRTPGRTGRPRARFARLPVFRTTAGTENATGGHGCGGACHVGWLVLGRQGGAPPLERSIDAAVRIRTGETDTAAPPPQQQLPIGPITANLNI